MEGSKTENEHTKRILKNSELRIYSMATVHELLYQSQSFNKLSFSEFVTKIAHSIQEVYTTDFSNIKINVDVDEIHLNVNQAVPCGLIINELVTNAFKHAYPTDGTGNINIFLREHRNKILLRVKDSGKGLPNDFVIGESESLGFTLVNILVKQLRAEIKVESLDGTDISIAFEKQNKKGSSSSMHL